jgi:hypothetical protein
MNSEIQVLKIRVICVMVKSNLFPNYVINKRDEVTGGWRKLLNEEQHGLYSSPVLLG